MTNRVLVLDESGLPGGSYACDLWCDILHMKGAEALATFEDDFYAGRPAITEHRVGKGRALYVATRPEPALMANLVGKLLEDLGITPTLEAPPGVEVTQREAGEGPNGYGRRYTFLLNHNAQTVHVSLPAPMRDLMTGKSHKHSISLQRYGVAIMSATRDGAGG